MIDEYLQHIQEGYIFSDKTISIDLDKFESGESNKLIIIGLSGGGKTTLGRYLADKYNCKFIEADSCFGSALTKDQKRDMIHSPTFDNETRKKYLKILYNKCFKQMLQSPERMVIEGPLQQAYSTIPESRKLMNKFSSIVLGTSALKAVHQRIVRSNARKKRTLKKNINTIIAATKLNFGWLQRDINTYKKYRITSNSDVKIFDVPKLIPTLSPQKVKEYKK
jgi:shikimate kinase